MDRLRQVRQISGFIPPKFSIVTFSEPDLHPHDTTRPASTQQEPFVHFQACRSEAILDSSLPSLAIFQFSCSRTCDARHTFLAPEPFGNSHARFTQLVYHTARDAAPLSVSRAPPPPPPVCVCGGGYSRGGGGSLRSHVTACRPA